MHKTNPVFSGGLLGSIFWDVSMFWGLVGFLDKVVTCLSLTLEALWPAQDGNEDNKTAGGFARNDLIA